MSEPRQKRVRLQIGKWAIWGTLIGVIFLLRHFLPVIFLTFILTYIGNDLVNRLGRRFHYRRINVAIIYALFLLLMTGAGLLIVPRMLLEARQLAVSYIAQTEDPDAPAVAPPAIPAPQDTSPPGPQAIDIFDREARKYVDTMLIQLVGRSTFESYRDSAAYQSLISRVENWIHNFIPKVIAGVRQFVNGTIVIVLQFFLSIILSFLILWDLPSIRAGVRSFSVGKTADIYAEIAPGMKAFAVILGRAFEAQTGIAIVNAILTSLGFFILGIPSIALLATIVFFCSYIPVVGVMLSTIPAALLAFEAGGISLVLWLIVMILVVHAVEAYALNPLIYGHHMKLHPVAILVILLIGEHLFGIWGLLLGVPIAAFVRTYVLAGPPAALLQPVAVIEE